MVRIPEGVLNGYRFALVLPSLEMLHYALAAEGLRSLVRIELIGLVVFFAGSKIFRLFVDGNSSMVMEVGVDGVHFVVVLIAEVLHIVDAEYCGDFVADCAIVDQILVQVLGKDLDLGLHHVEKSNLVGVVDAIRVAE